MNGDESCLITSPFFLLLLLLFLLLSLDVTSLSLCLPALHLTSLLPFPLLVTAAMCHSFYHFGGSCLLERSELISGEPRRCQDCSTQTATTSSLPVDGTPDAFPSQDWEKKPRLHAAVDAVRMYK
ncbi:unnamed protein product [Pleuronectes platessa]|uniref:Uncharacterized protein n=1 Tax=Pleuronectes platessa TaxID=8262 RepID=A0A9N7TZH1_PLEPL|nr:unnamed protein product [Pleuronectes platessa]